MIGATLCVALLAGAACSQGGPAAEPRASGSLSSSSGAGTVTIDADALSNRGAELSVASRKIPTDVAAELGDAVTPMGDGIAVELTGGELTGTARIDFELPADFNGEVMTPGIVWEDGNGGWELLTSAWTPGDEAVTAITDHFSWGFPVSIDWSKMAGGLTDWVGSLVTGRRGVDNPSCGDEAAARSAGIDVVSDSGDLVKWCVGVEDDRTIVKVTNNWQAGTQVQFPKGWNVVRYEGAGIQLQAIGDWLDSASRETDSTLSRLVSAGQTIVLEPTGQGTVTAGMSTVSWMVSIAVEAFALWLQVVGTVGRFTAEAIGGADLLLCFTTKYGDDADVIHNLTDPVQPDTLLQTITEASGFGLDCGEQVLRNAVADVDGLSGKVARAAVGVIAAAIGTVYGLVVAGFAGVRGLIDEIADIFDDSEVGGYGYDIMLIARTSPPPGTITASDDGAYSLAYEHPSLGPLTIVVEGAAVSATALRVTPTVTATLNSSGEVIFEWTAVDEYETFGFVGLFSDDTVSSPIDARNHVFFEWNPGRFNGISVLVPTATGFDDLGTFSNEPYGGYYYAYVVDVDADGSYEVDQQFQICEPTCADGVYYAHVWNWDGVTYSGSSEPPPPPPTTAGTCPVYPETTRLDDGIPVPCEVIAGLQRVLVELGYAVVPDGQFGPNTEAAIMSYQATNGLPVTGVVDQDTWLSILPPN